MVTVVSALAISSASTQLLAADAEPRVETDTGNSPLGRVPDSRLHGTMPSPFVTAPIASHADGILRAPPVVDAALPTDWSYPAVHHFRFRG